MHVLTKIFIVLVSLLAVFLVPLVVVYTHNEDSFKARYQQAIIQANTQRERLATAEATHGSREAELTGQINALSTTLAQVTQERDTARINSRNLESQLASAQAGQSEIQGELRKLAEGVVAAVNVNQSQLDELRALRSDFMRTERMMVELDEAYRDVQSQLEVAVAARRALQEELQRVSEEAGRAGQRLNEYIARYGALGDARDAIALGIIPDRDLTTTITSIRRTPTEVYVEIGAGSRDGVREGWTMTVGRGSNFLAKVRIVSVDVTRSTGTIMLEDSSRGLVQVGDTVISRAGID